MTNSPKLTNNIKKFCLINDNVCIRLKLYGEDIRNLLEGNLWQEVGKGDAEIIFINTCAFLKKAEDKATSTIENIIKNKKPHQQIAVFGCLPGMNLLRLHEIHNGLIFSGRNLEEIIKKFNLNPVQQQISYQVKRKVFSMAKFNKRINKFLLHDDYFTYLYDKEKVFHLKISEGCLGNCSYCAERFARGTLKSQKIDDIIKEFNRGSELGYKIFSLNADDTGFFGEDNQENIKMLLERILRINNDFKLVITEFNPAALIKFSEPLTALLSSPKVIFITLPMESGSQKILNLMNRHYDIDKVISILRKIKILNQKLKINTHIIVGFPGETEKNFMETEELLFKKFHFDKVKVFKYSERPKTAASLMDNKISEIVIEKRCKYLNRLILWQAIRYLRVKEFLLNFHNLFWGI